jgi:membrane fusion protein, multidrug efflux system
MAGHKIPHENSPVRYGVWARSGIALLVAAGLLMGGCGKKAEKAVTEKMVNVKVSAVEKKSVRPYIETIGSLNASDEVTVSAEVDGILKGVLVDEGTPVGKGTILARVDTTDYQLGVDNAEAALKQAEAALANVKVEFGRKEALFKEELVTRQQFDDVSLRRTMAERDLDRAQVMLSLAKQRLGKTTIASPLKGVVKEKKVASGDFARTSQPLLTIVQIDPLKLIFTIAEKDVSLLKPGQEVTFAVDPYPGREFSGIVSAINPSLDERTRSLKAEAVVHNEAGELKPGFFARVKVFTSASKSAVVIPSTSILYEGTKVRVFLQEGAKAQERSLKLGGKYGELVEVLEGLSGGERLIVVGQNGLTNGVKINVVQ